MMEEEELARMVAEIQKITLKNIQIILEKMQHDLDLKLEKLPKVQTDD